MEKDRAPHAWLGGRADHDAEPGTRPDTDADRPPPPLHTFSFLQQLSSFNVHRVNQSLNSNNFSCKANQCSDPATLLSRTSERTHHILSLGYEPKLICPFLLPELSPLLLAPPTHHRCRCTLGNRIQTTLNSSFDLSAFTDVVVFYTR
jgi:hypothetical protein